MESIDGEFAKAKEDLYNRAESLGIKNYKRMKLTTLIDKIVRVETNKTLGEKGIVNTGD